MTAGKFTDRRRAFDLWTSGRWRSIAVVLALAWVPAADAVEIHAMISGGFSAAFEELVPIYEKQSGNRIATARGPSMGETPQAIPNRLARGEACDVVIMVESALDDLIEKGRVMKGSRVDLASAGIAMAVKAGVPLPDIGSVDAFKHTLAAAKSIAYSDSASGVYLQNVLFPKIDEDGKIRAKSRMIPAEPVGRVVARGEADLGFQQKSELQPIPGIVIVGPIPGALQKITVFAAGIASNATEADAARDFIRFLTSRDAQPAIFKSGMDPANSVARLPGGEMINPPKGAEMTKQPGTR